MGPQTNSLDIFIFRLQNDKFWRLALLVEVGGAPEEGSEGLRVWGMSSLFVHVTLIYLLREVPRPPLVVQCSGATLHCVTHLRGALKGASS